MKFTSAEIQGIINIEPIVYNDDRGYFYETFQVQHFSEAGIPTIYLQDNQSGSNQGVIRGLHYQIHQAQGKLIRVIAGEIFDVAVDLRKKSPTCGKWNGLILSADNKQQVWVPPGFAMDSTFLAIGLKFYIKPQIIMHRNGNVLCFGTTQQSTLIGHY